MRRRVESTPDLAQSESAIADYANQASLDKPFEGVDRAFIVSGYAEPGRRAELHRNAFQAASRAGVRHPSIYRSWGHRPSRSFPCHETITRVNST
jgi:NAD(P)H dehydrogenase (quinone)